MDEFVLVQHSVTGATWLCPAGVVAEWAAIGWKPVTDDDAPAAEEPAAPAAPTPKPRPAATSTPTEGS